MTSVTYNYTIGYIIIHHVYTSAVNCVCVRACVRACLRACVRACVCTTKKCKNGIYG